MKNRSRCPFGALALGHYGTYDDVSKYEHCMPIFYHKPSENRRFCSKPCQFKYGAYIRGKYEFVGPKTPLPATTL